MPVRKKLVALGLTIVALTACADEPASPRIADPALTVRTAALVDATTGLAIELKQPKVHVTDWVDETVTVLASVVTGATGIGPGSPILITIPGEGRFGCTANFVWKSGGRFYLGSAGHCFLPAVKKSTHGEGADYDASGVTVQVCVENCQGNFRTALLVGTMVKLGKVAYARQTDPTDTEPVGNDFGVVEIPVEAEHLIRPAMPVWGGPRGFSTVEQGKIACHYGNGVGAGELFPTKARVGVGGGGDDAFWMGDFVGTFGDSGSALNGCETDGVTIVGTGAAGVLTHLGVSVCPCDVKFKNVRVIAEHGIVFGTTTRRAIEMGREAGLDLRLVEA